MQMQIVLSLKKMAMIARLDNMGCISTYLQLQAEQKVWRIEAEWKQEPHQSNLPPCLKPMLRGIACFASSFNFWEREKYMH